MKTLNLKEDAEKLSNKKLKEEIEGIEQHISEFSYGRFELIWREALYKESERRKLKIEFRLKVKWKQI